jgi:hypothetical protein
MVLNFKDSKHKENPKASSHTDDLKRWCGAVQKDER